MSSRQVFSLLAGSALLFATAASNAQESEDSREDEEILEILDDADESEAGPGPREGPRFGRDVALPANVIEVRSVEGALQPPFAETEYCTETQCEAAVVNTESGQIAYFLGQWQPRYIATRRGAQIVYVQPAPIAHAVPASRPPE